MDNLASSKRFKSLPDQAEWREEEIDDDVLERAALGHWPLGPPPPPQSIVLTDGQPPCPGARAHGAMASPPVDDDAVNKTRPSARA